MIDYSRKYQFRLFLASCEINYRACKDTPTKNWLCSFYYLRGMPKSKLEHFLKDAKYGLTRLGIEEERTMFLDSGAFSFQNAAGCIAGRTNKDVSELGAYPLLQYTLDYIDFINEYGEYFDIIAEVDVDYIIGVRKTKYLYDRIKKDIKYKDRFIPVWHIPRGEEIWKNECKNRYHGIEGQTRHRDDPISFYNNMLKIAHAENSKVHGFALTALDLLHRVPMDSADSASWMLQAANGTVKTPFGTIAISDRSIMNGEVGDTLNYANLNTLQRKEFEAYVTSKGFNVEELKHEWKSRAALNTYYYNWMEDKINREWAYLNKKKVYQKNLFSSKQWHT